MMNIAKRGGLVLEKLVAGLNGLALPASRSRCRLTAPVSAEDARALLEAGLAVQLVGRERGEAEGPTWGEGEWVELTREGLDRLQQILLRRALGEGVPTGNRPRWAKGTLQLWVGAQLVADVPPGADKEIALLDLLEKHGWPPHLSNEILSAAGSRARRRCAGPSSASTTGSAGRCACSCAGIAPAGCAGK
jgi:hypothetical protein